MARNADRSEGRYKGGIVIGLVGQPSAGKDTAASYLNRRGFQHISTGDIIRADMAKRSISTDRAHMHTFAAEMRKTVGMSYPATYAATMVADGVHTIISGLRNTTEVKVLKEKFGARFLLLALTIPIEVRYERAHARNRIGDDISFEQFKQEEEFERKSNSGAYEMDQVISEADYVIDNAGTEQEFFKKLDDFLHDSFGL